MTLQLLEQFLLRIIYEYIEDYQTISKYRKQYKHDKEVNEAMVSRPNSYYSAEELYNEGLYKDALSALEPALNTLNLIEEDILPSREDVYLLESKCEFGLKNYDQALKTLGDLNKIDANNTDCARLEQDIRQEKYNTEFQKISLEIESIKAKKEGYFVPTIENIVLPGYNSSDRDEFYISTGLTYACLGMGIIGYFVSNYYEKHPEMDYSHNTRRDAKIAMYFGFIGAFVWEMIGYYSSYNSIIDRNREKDSEIEDKLGYLESIKP